MLTQVSVSATFAIYKLMASSVEGDTGLSLTFMLISGIIATAICTIGLLISYILEHKVQEYSNRTN